MSESANRPMALVEMTNAKQLRISTLTTEGVPVEVALDFTLIEAQKFAQTAYDLWIPGNEWRRPGERKCTFLAVNTTSLTAKGSLRMSVAELQESAQKARGR